METFVNSLLDRISSYDLFTNLLPGVLYCVAIDKYLNCSLLGNSFWVDICICYGVGMCISRFGSFLETQLTKEFLKHWVPIYLERANYFDYLEAEKLDTKITLLNTVNNLYRSIMALILCYILTVLYYYTLGGWFHNYPMVYQLCVAITLFLLFYYSFRKQTGYIKKRVQNALQHFKKESQK